jgi:hypothetical protein
MKRLAYLTLLVSVAAIGCKSEPTPPPPPPVTAPPTTQPAPVSVKALTVGKAIDAEKKIAAPSDTLGVKDTIYASVETTGTGHAKVRALWSFVKGEKTAKVDESTIELNASGPETNEFHIAKPSGWPKGDYRVEIFLNDETAAAQSKTFKVG